MVCFTTYKIDYGFVFAHALSETFHKEKHKLWDREKSLDAYDGKEIVSRYRLSRQLITQLYDDIGLYRGRAVTE